MTDRMLRIVLGAALTAAALLTAPAVSIAQQHEMHAGGHHGHGQIIPESKDFPTIAYDETRQPRPVQQSGPPAAAGNPHRGKHLAYSPKGRCLTCHVMGADGDQAGSVGPNLSAYGNSNRDPAWTFQQIWDARAHNPETLMPPFGTNGLLTEAEVADIAAYLQTLKQAIAPPARPPLRAPRQRIYVGGEDLSMADSYVEAGKALFEKAGHNGRSCADCHGAGKEGPALDKAAARYPKYNEARGGMVNLEQRINMCRAKYMDSRHLHLGSQPSNVLTSYVKYLARNAPIEVATGGAAAEAAKRGGELFSRRSGQLNLSCASCHVDAAGQWLRGQHLDRLDDIAGQWPKHYIALHDLGLISLQQRIRHCQIVTRSYPLALGSKEYTDLETYLTSLSNGTPVLAPTMSRMRGE